MIENVGQAQNGLVATGVPACRKHRITSSTGRDACATNMNAALQSAQRLWYTTPHIMQIYGLSSLAAFGAGFVNAIAGGGTLLTFPALLYCGMPSITANATSTVAVWPGSVTSSWAYRRQLSENRARVWTLALPSLIGGLLGAILLLKTPESFFRLIVPFLILLACALLQLNEPIGRWISQRAAANPKKHAAAIWLSQFAIAVYGGYFGAGMGILMLAAMAIFLPEDLAGGERHKELPRGSHQRHRDSLFYRGPRGGLEDRPGDGARGHRRRIRRRETRATNVTPHSARRNRHLRRDRGGAFDDKKMIVAPCSESAPYRPNADVVGRAVCPTPPWVASRPPAGFAAIKVLAISCWKCKQ